MAIRTQDFRLLQLGQRNKNMGRTLNVLIVASRQIPGRRVAERRVRVHMAKRLSLRATQLMFHPRLLKRHKTEGMSGVSALHYSTRSCEVFWTLASACALCLTTFYLCPSI